MFQTEPILFLQGISSTLFHHLMLFVNLTGPPVVGIFLSLVLVAFDRRRGAVMLGLVVVTAVANELIRDFVALPRPMYVDNHIQFLDRIKVNEGVFASMGADSFFSALPQSVVDYHRANFDGHFGFPSGHVSSTLVFWGGLTMLYRRMEPLVAACFFVPMVAIARMYLGKHFLADVLGGALLGCLVLVAAVLLQRAAKPALREE